MGNGRPQSTPESFWRKIDRRGPDECWPWLASIRNGYGNHCINKVTCYAHRYAYELSHGKPPAGRAIQVMHSCNNKLCCNPAHLSLGTASQNTMASYKDGLTPAGERHGKAKYSDSLIEIIRADPRSQLELERVYGVSQAHISRIKRGEIRKGVDRG